MGEAKTKLDEALARVRALELHRKQLMQSVTLRDQFAMSAATGLLASGIQGTDWAPRSSVLAIESYRIADAMLKERVEE